MQADSPDSVQGRCASGRSLSGAPALHISFIGCSERRVTCSRELRGLLRNTGSVERGYHAGFNDRSSRRTKNARSRRKNDVWSNTKTSGPSLSDVGKLLLLSGGAGRVGDSCGAVWILGVADLFGVCAPDNYEAATSADVGARGNIHADWWKLSVGMVLPPSSWGAPDGRDWNRSHRGWQRLRHGGTAS